MSKAVLISTRPNWCELKASGKKTNEIRKTRPKLMTPFKCYIYCTMDNAAYNPKNYLWKEDKTGRLREIYWNGKVIGEFVCDSIKCITPDSFIVKEDAERALLGSCLTPKQAKEYAGWKPGEQLSERKDLYSWHISDLVIYDKPKEISEFYKKCETMRCEGCEHLKWQRINSDEYEYECEYLERIPIIRPPQSWCFVEEIA